MKRGHERRWIRGTKATGREAEEVDKLMVNEKQAIFCK